MKYLVLISLLLMSCGNYDAAIKKSRDDFVHKMNIEKVSCDEPGIEGVTTCSGIFKNKPVDFECFKDMCRWIYPHI